MANMKKMVGAAALTTGLVATALGFSAGTAQAATYNGACGAGYGVIDSHNLGSKGTIFLTIKNGTNCVVTIRNNPGSPVYMDARISLADAPWKDDPGNWTTYAGPVYQYAPNQCIDWAGEITGTYWQELGTHCG